MEIKEFSVREVNIALDPSWTPTNLQVIFKRSMKPGFEFVGFGIDLVGILYRNFMGFLIMISISVELR